MVSDKLFEMRRLEALSNTIFGVAMTLMAYDIPSGDTFKTAPDWAAIWNAYEPHLLTLLLSFSVAGLFWYSHQRRLTYAPEANRFTVIVNLLFLLSIILLPATTGLYGSYPFADHVIALYGFHLMIIALINLALWVMAAAPRGDWLMAVGPVFTGLVFVAAAIVVPFAPRLAQSVWFLAFVAPAVASYAERRA